MLRDSLPRMEKQLRAVGAVAIRSAEGGTYRTGFLVAPDLILTANHVIEPVLEETATTPRLRQDATVRFVLGDGIDDPQATSHELTLVAIDKDSRLALLRTAFPVVGASPLEIVAAGTSLARDERVYLIGYPFLQNDLDPALVAHVFGEHIGTKRVQPGFVVAAPQDRRGFDHDAFTMGGSAGSPVISLQTGLVVGLHWGGMIQANFKRGRAAGLWKPENRRILADAGVAGS
jgi:hypothetical protein